MLEIGIETVRIRTARERTNKKSDGTLKNLPKHGLILCTLNWTLNINKTKRVVKKKKMVLSYYTF